jgi:hypothetical protein
MLISAPINLPVEGPNPADLHVKTVNLPVDGPDAVDPFARLV